MQPLARLVCFTGALLLGLSGASGAQGEERSEQIANHSGWRVAAITEFDRFKFCLTTKFFDRPEPVWVSFMIDPAGVFRIALNEENWQLPRGAEFGTRVDLGRQGSFDARFRVTAPDMGHLTVAEEDRFVQGLLYADQMQLHTAETVFHIHLTGLPHALNSLQQCWDSRSGARVSRQESVSRNPFSQRDPARTARREPDPEAPALEESALAVGRTVVRQLARQGFEPFDRIPDYAEDYQAAYIWRTPNGIGFAGWKYGEADLAGVLAHHEKSERATCRRGFGSHAFERPVDFGPPVMTVQFGCLNETVSGGAVYKNYSYFTASANGYVVVIHISNDARDADWYDQVFFDKLKQIMAENDAS